LWGRKVDLFLALVCLRLVVPRLGFVEEPQRIHRSLLVLGREALGAQQADGLFEEADAIALFGEQRLLREHECVEIVHRIRESHRVISYGSNI
jgi:hypothetical protein